MGGIPPHPGEGQGVLLHHRLWQVLDHCPYTSLAPTVEAPLLVPEAVEMLENTLPQDDYSTWKMLGMAWNVTRWDLAHPEAGVCSWRGDHTTHHHFLPACCRAEYPNGHLVPSYVPVFSDGWLPPPLRQVQHRSGHSDPRMPHCLPQFPYLALNTHPSLSLSVPHRSWSPTRGMIPTRRKFSR